MWSITFSSVKSDATQPMLLRFDFILGTAASTSDLSDASHPEWFVIGYSITDVKKVPGMILRTIPRYKNYHNPFNLPTIICYNLPKVGKLVLKAIMFQ